MCKPNHLIYQVEHSQSLSQGRYNWYTMVGITYKLLNMIPNESYINAKDIISLVGQM